MFYTFDPQGSVVQRLDGSQNILSTSAYDAWGNPLAPGTEDPFGYCAEWGYYTDSETGLLLLTHRYYDPWQARFVTRDPIGSVGSINQYAYVWNILTRIYDPLGIWGLVIDDSEHPSLCFGDCSHPNFVFGYSGWMNDLSRSYGKWWGCMGKCMAAAYGIPIGWNIIRECKYNKWMPGGRGGGGKRNQLS